MIQAYTGDRLIVGVTRGNIDRLTAGKPMVVRFADHANIREVFVLFGEDKPAILQQLEDAGLEIAKAMKDSAVDDPL